MKLKSNKQAGFTIIELMVSTVVFTLVLLAATVAMVQVSRLYYRGVTQARIQETARGVSDEITQSIQFSAQAVKVPNYPGGASSYGPEVNASTIGNGQDTFYFCIGPKRYSFAVDRQLRIDSPDSSKKEKRHVFWVDVPANGCAEAAGAVNPADLTQNEPTSEGRELLDENMRITKLELLSSGNNNIWTLNIFLAYGDEDLLAVNNGRKVCEGSRFGIELCATSELSSTILRRVQ